MLAARGALRRGRLPVAGAGIWAVQPRGPPRLPPHVVDLRSDTVTQPCAAMRSAMARAAVGDDDYGEDPTVNELQRLAAGTLGMEEALFLPTATMANLIAVMCHCQRRGAQVILGRDSHLHVYEHGGVAQVRGLADRYGLQVHMDGARLMNAAVALNVEPAQITKHCDSVTLCFSKGLGAPAGAVLAGRKDFVAEAWRMRKLLGGGMRQAGVLAAAALVGLEHMGVRLRRDHDNAWRFAEGIQELNSPLCSVNLTAVETNIVMVNISGGCPSPAELCEHLRAVSEKELAKTGHAVSVLLFPWSARTVRAVWHRGVSAHDTELARKKLEFVARRCQEELTLGLHPTPPSVRGA
ncbi:uncharacterized protein LOC133225137 isoform X3 [Neopsephotus bourkii]|uniref:uncharacterized protein LOC133225137 isoform X3 n=1 Tax=Neopsephotus bourkii TaxID=309878 RepID=UPI002AA529A7|nr:uncharacterized protein LOC133225137 isoform X3 [Neopsephotus bourkii]